MTHDDELTPLPVRVVSQPAQPARTPVYATTYKVVTIQTAGQATELLPASDSRTMALVLPLDDDVVVGGNMSDVTRGFGAILEKSLSAPVPIQDSGAVWVSAQTIAGTSSRVTVIATHVTYQ